MASRYPEIGRWFLDMTDNSLFEIVAIDDQNHCIEIQYQHGEVSEYDLESWLQLPLEGAQAPEDAAAGYELARDDQWGNDIAALSPMAQQNPLAELEPDSFPGIEDF